jgi:uncharacterized protein (DUF305 family)
MRHLRVVLTGLSLLVLAIVPDVFADAPVEGRIGRAEVRFMEGMIDHHQMAIDMASDCLAREVSDELRAECQAVVDAQQPEIEQMQAWLLSWYNVEYSPISMMGDNTSGMDHGGDHDSMGDGPATDPAMMMGMMAGFNRLEGVDYEITWLEAMIDHHDDAIHMAQRLLDRDADSAAHAELRELAENIINAQSEEISRYEAMIASLIAS